MASKHNTINLDEKFQVTVGFTKQIAIIFIIGLLLLVIGMVQLAGSSSGASAEEHSALVDAATSLASTDSGGEGVVASVSEGGHGFKWITRIYANLWINNVYFTGLAIIGLFFIAYNYVANSGWASGLKRIAESFTSYLPIGFVIMLVVFFIANHDLFHWTHGSLYKEGLEYDAIIDGKKGFFFGPGVSTEGLPFFYLIRMVVFFSVWILFAHLIKKQSLAEDLNGGYTYYRKMIKLSAGFIVFFGVSSSVSAWDWIMSIDTHWFSTMFGWYVFASWFVSGLAAITLTAILLKKAGYLSIINENHLHDMGKFVFAFSIFWTYIWFSQFLLIYYANIPEEVVYFVERLENPLYGKLMIFNLFINFAFPFLGLMTRDAKRKTTLLQIVCVMVMIGHWLDFFLMVTPGTLRENGSLGFVEIGMAMVFLSVFIFIVGKSLASRPLIAKNHPLLEECIHHHI